MPNVDFSRFYYYPCLQCSPEERIAYRHLSDAVKDRLIPLFELSIRSSNQGWFLAEDELREACGERPFILDLCKNPAPQPFIPNAPTADDDARIVREWNFHHTYNESVSTLLVPSDGFHNWRNLAERFPNAIPMVVYSDAEAQSRQIIRQASLLSRGGNSIAIMVVEGQELALCAIVPQIINVLDSASQLIIVFDAGHARQFVARRTQFVTRAIERIIAGLEVGEISAIRSVCIRACLT